MALVSQADLEARLGRALTSEEQTAFTIINAGMQALVEKSISSSLEDEEPSERYFDGGLQHLPIDPCTDISTVVQVDDDEVPIYTYDTTDYTLEPRNTTLKTMLRHRQGRFVTGINNIRVTARFSIYRDTETLAIVKDALIDALVSEVGNNSNIKRESIEGYSVEYATTEAKNAMNKIKMLFPQI